MSEAGVRLASKLQTNSDAKRLKKRIFDTKADPNKSFLQPPRLDLQVREGRDTFWNETMKTELSFNPRVREGRDCGTISHGWAVV